MQQISLRALIFVGWGLATFAASGCWKSAPASKLSPVTAAPSAPVAAESQKETPAANPPESKATEGAAADATTEQGTAAATNAATAAVTPSLEVPLPAASRERIILLAPASPIIIDLQLTIDGQPHTAVLEKLVREVLKLADTDGDGQTQWKELCASKRIKYGQFGNLAIENENGEKQVIEKYDINRDGIVDETELPRFLTRNAGGSRPFSIRGTFDHQGLNRRGAATWRVLDADDDGVLSPAEQAAAAARLGSRDTNDDEILVASELDTRLQSPDPEMMAERRRRGPDAVRLLGPHADWGSVQLALEQTYGGSRILRPDSFPLTPELFTQLDKNGDGRVRRDEFAALNDVPPQLVIAVEFGPQEMESGAKSHESEEEDAEQARRNQPRLRLIRAAPELAASGQSVVEQPGRLTLAIGGLVLTFYTNDTVASDNFAARAKQALDMFDADKNGYLEKGEIPDGLQAQFGRFEAVDADEDGKAYAGEIEAYLAQQQAGLRAQIHAKASDREDALFAALDADHDERLDSREIEGAVHRLAALDRNSDGQISADELPEPLMIGLARGSLEQADATFRPPPVIVRSPSEKSPRWFTAMDANGDGAISRREFVGSAEKFAELDADGNGLLELAEAMKAANQ